MITVHFSDFTEGGRLVFRTLGNKMKNRNKNNKLVMLQSIFFQLFLCLYYNDYKRFKEILRHLLKNGFKGEKNIG
jgi:hypothetical protein